MPINYKRPIETRDLRNGDWFWVNRQVWEHEGLTQSDKVVYGTLALFCNQSQESFPSIETLAKFSKISPRQVYRSIKSLEKYNFIEIIRGGGRNKPNIYILLKITDRKNPDKLSSNKNPDKSHEKTLTKTLTNSTSNNNNNKKKKKNIIKRKRKRKSLKSITEEDFEYIANFYQVPVAFVKSKYDDLVNYCEAKGKRYRDYLAALRNFVKQDAIKIRKEARDKSLIV